MGFIRDHVVLGRGRGDSVHVDVTVALIGAGLALVTSFISLIATRGNERSLERLKADLSERSATRQARLEYEFEARKRLYKECAPILFELAEASDRAMGRIAGLARTAQGGNLDPGPSSWLRRRYYQRSTYYRAIAPLALIRSFRARLTDLDLVLDPVIHWQYEICKRLADSFTDDFDCSRIKPNLPYNPHAENAMEARRQYPAEFWQQGIPRGILDNAATSLLEADTAGRLTLVSYAEFEKAMDDDNTEIHKAFQRIDYLFEDFHPRTRPVLWRVLLGQAHLYKAFLLSRTQDPPQLPVLLGAEEGEWLGDPRQPFCADDPNPLVAGQAYAMRGLEKVYGTIWPRESDKGAAV